MRENNLVSIVVPIYNAEKHIKRCVNSVLKQEYKNLEILLINDGSTDHSLEIIETLSSNDSRIKIIDKNNEGVAETRNLGIKLATGKYIMFIDNDDFITSNYVKDYADKIIDLQYDIIIGGYQRVNSDDKVLFSDYPRDSQWGKYIVLAPWAKIYNLQFLKNSSIQFLNYPIGEDVYFNLIAFSNTDKIESIHNLDYKWFYNEKSISNTSQSGFSEQIDILFLLNKIISSISSSDNDYFKYFIKRYYVWYLLFLGRRSTPTEFVIQYKRIKQWIQENSLISNLNPLSKKLSGEGYKNRIIVLVFSVIEKTHLISLFSKFYCQSS